MPEQPPGLGRLSETEADTLAGAPGGGASRPPSTGSLDGGRFTPGAIVGARYRIVGLRGRGGMGEVYRAEDLRLGETVALKFLPEKLARDGAALARFHREVRTARLITHRNVVRVHDLGEIAGQPFLSMEYVDGEDLASLLRRIGRLPADKAVELAHQLCAGLAAAHERGVLHRDLKPGNVLVDGKGSAKITDFGLAALASDLESPELVGTPLYMAPEHLGEGRVSYASDVYSLGLVLYEMFTGRRPFDAESPAELLQQVSASDAPRLSSRVHGLDRRIDDAVLHCLRREPEQRPRSPLDISAALPGGDPLAAALAAGETPSPEMVARAQGAGTLSRRAGLGLLALALGGIAAVLLAAAKTSAVSLAAPLPPEVLVHQARAVLDIARFEGEYEAWDYGYTESAEHRLSGELPNLQSWRDLAGERPGFMEFWYREAPFPLMATRRFNWRVTLDDPALTTPGTATVTLDGKGRLRSFVLAPAIEATDGEPAIEATDGETDGASRLHSTLDRDATQAPAPFDWAPFFAAAELPMDAVTPAAPERAPPLYADHVVAWTGAYPGQAEPRVWVEAAARGGRIVYWEVREATPEGSRPVPSLPALAFVAFALMWIGAGVLARRHLRSGSGDNRGAFRFATAVSAATFVGPLLLAHHSGSAIDELALLFSALTQGSMFGVMAWLFYMALEPYSRRVAPRWVVSWTRLLEGRVRDPMVGRDVLSGLAAGAAVYGAISFAYWLAMEQGPARLDWFYPHGFAPLRGALPTLANVLHPSSLLVPFGVMFVLILTKGLLRREWLAIGVAALIVVGFQFLFNGVSLPGLLLAVLLLVVGYRWGLLALVAVGLFLINVALVPISADPALWWSARSWLGWGFIVALALYAFRIATARPMVPARPPTRG